MVERERLKAVYKTSKKWAAKVDAMKDSQVIAVLKSFISQGKA